MPSRLLQSLSRKDRSSPTAKAIGPSITLQPMKERLHSPSWILRVCEVASGYRPSVPGEYEAKIQVSVRRFQKCSSVRADCRESQSPTIWLRKNRKRGSGVTEGDKAIHL